MPDEVVLIRRPKYMINYKQIDLSWPKKIEEGVRNEVSTILDNTAGTPPVVKHHDGFDFDIGGNADKIGPGVSYNGNPEGLLDAIDMNHMSVLIIEPAGFQTF